MVGVDTLLVLQHNKRAFTNYVDMILTIIGHLPTIFDRVLLLLQRKICILLTFSPTYLARPRVVNVVCERPFI